MATKEEQVRNDIVTKFGSIPKMASKIGMAPTTIYHALERGLDNTSSKTRSAILESLYGRTEYAVIRMWSDDEEELIELYRNLPANAKRALLAGLREYGNGKEK